MASRRCTAISAVDRRPRGIPDQRRGQRADTTATNRRSIAAGGMAGDDGSIMHAEVEIGDSLVMIGGASGEFSPTTAMLHLYVSDVDAWYKRAVEAGAESLRKPTDQHYGDRSAGLKDGWGNGWWLATHIKGRLASVLHSVHQSRRWRL